MAAKHDLFQDPEYEAIADTQQNKRIKLMEDSGRNQTTKKIGNIIKSNYLQEIDAKTSTLDNTLKNLLEARAVLERLRVCVITKFYASGGQEQTSSTSSNNILPSIHPTSKNYLGKSPKFLNSSHIVKNSNTDSKEGIKESSSEVLSRCKPSLLEEAHKKVEMPKSYLSPSKDISSRAPRIQTKIIIGNISKYIPLDRREENFQHVTHQWMIYVRGDSNSPGIESFVKKVRFFLHSSYKPNDIVEISSPPFHLIRKGWGEFEVRVQMFFHDPRNKHIDVPHFLKLDRTYSSFQTSGKETVIDLQLFKKESTENKCFNNSFLPSISNFPSSSNFQANKSYNKTNSDSVVSIKKESEVNSKASVIVTSADSVVTSTDPCSNIQNVPSKTFPKESSSDDSSNITIPNGDLSYETVADIPNGTSVSKSVVPDKFFVNNTDLETKLVNKNSLPNGTNTTYVKCTDLGGRVLIVPTSRLSFKNDKLSSSASTNNTAQVNPTGKPSKLLNSRPSVSSYFLKVVPNNNKGQKQVVLIPMAEKKQLEKKIPTEVSHHNDFMVNCLSDGKSNNMIIADSTKLKSFHGDFWEQELSNIKIHYYTSFTDLLKRVCDAIPLVKEGVDRSKYSFCASSLEEFLRWNVGKQRACEWKRAGLVRKTLLDIVKKNKISFATEENVWPRHVIMSWCRKNGFVPMTTEKMTLLPEPKWSGVELCSVSNVNDLLSNLKEDGSKSDSSEDDIEIDILEVSNEKSLLNKGNSNHQQYTHLPHLNPASAFVKETASQIGVDIKPLEMEPSVHIPVIEEMILSACRQLATNIIRNSLNAGYNRMGGQLCPEEITVSDVYSAVKDTPEFDFLSNNYLGVPKEENENT